VFGKARISAGLPTIQRFFPVFLSPSTKIPGCYLYLATTPSSQTLSDSLFTNHLVTGRYSMWIVCSQPMSHKIFNLLSLVRTDLYETWLCIS
jgi:hypothetical protein